MAEAPRLGRGTVVTYLDRAGPGEVRFHRAVVTGSGVVDPVTGVVWISVVRPDCELTLLDPDQIVSTAGVPVDDEKPIGDMVGPIDVFAAALGTLAEDLMGVDERSNSALPRAKSMLDDFVDAIAPVEPVLAALVEANPTGGLATVVGCVSTAVDEFEVGRFIEAKLGILIAEAAMAELMAETEPGAEPDADPQPGSD